MSKPIVGKLLPVDGEFNRDAIHVPIVPVFASTVLIGGERIGIEKREDGKLWARAARESTLDEIAIVDPFLWHAVNEGSQFYAFMLPGKVHSLWHEWTCKSLDGPRRKA